MTTESISQVNYDLVADFPKDWEIVPVSTIAENHDNKRQPIKSTDREHMRGPYPYCGANGVVDHIDRYKLDGEYVLVAEDGGYWGKGDDTAYIMRGKFFVNNHAHILRAVEDKTTNIFLMLMLNYMNIDPLIGGDARGKLTKSVLSNLPFPLPPLLEQKAIARVLTTVQDAITEQERLIEKLRELKRSMMSHLFTHGTKSEKTKMTYIGEIPESWTVVDFESLCVLQRGKDLTKSNFREGTVPVAGSNGVIGYHDVFNAKAPAVTVGRSGSVGIVKYYEMDVWVHNTALYVRDFKGNNPLFTAYYLEYLKLNNYKGGASVPTLDRNQFRTMPIALPGFSEQVKIASALVSIDNRLKVVEQKANIHRALFKTLLHELMSGERRIKNI